MLQVVKEMYQRRPRTFGFDRSKDRLMVWCGLACPNRGVFNQNVVFTGDFPDSIKQCRGFRWIFEHRLILTHPPVAFRPGLALFHVNSLLGQLASPGAKLLL